jgi:hypothetical protein
MTKGKSAATSGGVGTSAKATWTAPARGQPAAKAPPKAAVTAGGSSGAATTITNTKRARSERSPSPAPPRRKETPSEHSRCPAPDAEEDEHLDFGGGTDGDDGADGGGDKEHTPPPEDEAGAFAAKRARFRAKPAESLARSKQLCALSDQRRRAATPDSPSAAAGRAAAGAASTGEWHRDSTPELLAKLMDAKLETERYKRRCADYSMKELLRENELIQEKLAGSLSQIDECQARLDTLTERFQELQRLVYALTGLANHHKGAERARSKQFAAALHKPPEFSGKKSSLSVRDWLTCMSDYLTGSGIAASDAQRIALAESHLRDEARRSWLCTRSVLAPGAELPQSGITFETFQKALIDRWDPCML